MSNPSHYPHIPGDKVVLMDSNTVFTIKTIDPIEATFTSDQTNPIPLNKAVPLDTAIAILEERLNHLRDHQLSPLQRYKRKVQDLEMLTNKAPFEGISHEEVKKALYPLCKVANR